MVSIAVIHLFYYPWVQRPIPVFNFKRYGPRVDVKSPFGLSKRLAFKGSLMEFISFWNTKIPRHVSNFHSFILISHSSTTSFCQNFSQPPTSRASVEDHIEFLAKWFCMYIYMYKPLFYNLGIVRSRETKIVKIIIIHPARFIWFPSSCQVYERAS